MDRLSKALELAKGKTSEVPAVPAAAPVNDFSSKNIHTINVPKAVLRRNRVITTLEDGRIVDSYKLLRTRVLRSMQQNGWNTLGVTSAGPNVGKTLTSVNLAISISLKENLSAMVVDTDLRRPSVHSIFEINPDFGLEDYLSNRSSIHSLLINPGIEHFSILPNKGSREGTSSELVASPRMLQLVEEIRAGFSSQIVIFDLPPVLVGDDVVAFAPHLDAVLVVIEDGKTTTPELTHTFELLHECNILGTVLNKSNDALKNMDYYYY
ncbi:MAG: CpsD/CapB family tyrosine-protein kinase [Gammaproteobacteria bacterium]|nr:CpsD/CapB family tyrosine-protein kinase [Gammaproteobacteria bacterium]